MVREALARGPDLTVAADVALRQRVSPLLLRALDAVDGIEHAGDPPWVPELRADAARCAAQAALVLPRLAETGIGPLVDAGFEPVVMKGAALSARYPEPGLRPMDDVDVLLPADQLGAAVTTLEHHGWVRQQVPGRHHHEVMLSHPSVPGLPLEVHARFSTWHERANHLSPRRLWERRQPCQIAGVAAFAFTPEDELVVLASHAAKPFHVFGRLLWSVDVAVVIGDGGLDWHRVATLAKDSACRTALAVALTQAARLGADSPIDLRTTPATGTRRAALDPVLSEEWPVLARDFGVRDRMRYALVDDPRLWALLLGESIVGDGIGHAATRAARTGRRIMRRWRLLRRSGEQLREDVGHIVEP